MATKQTPIEALTKPQRRALEILATGPKTPTEFAEQMWPDSPGWTRVYSSGQHGSSAGKAMPRTGGAYLGKLRQRGLVARAGDYDYMITRKGHDALERNE